LRIKFRLGLFDQPYTDEAREPNALLRPESIRLAREIAGPEAAARAARLADPDYPYLD